MTEARITLARHRLARARESFADGLLLFERGSRTGAVNRFYYAAFHAARALLVTKGLDSSKHSGVIALFQQHFVKTGTVRADIAKALPRSFERRQDSDYEDFIAPTAEEVASIRDTVAEFIRECERVLSRLGGGKPDDI